MDRVSLVLILQRKRSSNTRQDLYLTLCHDPSLINVLLLPLQVLWGLHPSLSLQTFISWSKISFHKFNQLVATQLGLSFEVVYSRLVYKYTVNFSNIKKAINN